MSTSAGRLPTVLTVTLVLIAALVAPFAKPSAVAAATATPTDESSPSTFYVRPDGDDSADGQTVATAWRTLGKALRRAAPGTTTYLLNGTYTQARCGVCGAHFRLATSGRADAWIRIRNYPGSTPRIVANAGTGIELVGSYLELSGLTITGEGFGPGNDWGYGIMYEGGHHITIRDNTVSGFPLAGIGGTQASGLTIADNVVFDNARWNANAGSGISVWRPVNLGVEPGPDGYHDRIVGNVVFGNENITPTPAFAPPGLVSDGNGIIVDETLGTGYTGRILVANNIAVNNGGRGIAVFKSANVDLIHNTLYRNGFTTNMYGPNSDLSVGSSSSIGLVNNLVEARNGGLAYRQFDSAQVTMTGNHLSGRVDGPVPEANVITTQGAGFESPGLDPRLANFHLSPSSPAIDGGTTVVAHPVNTDRDGRARPLRGAPDPGAYESPWSAPASSPPPGAGAGDPGGGSSVDLPPPASASCRSTTTGSGPTATGSAAIGGSTGQPCGLWVGFATGAVRAVGDAVPLGDMSGLGLNAPLVGMASTADGHGYWLLGRDGGIFSFGNAAFHGSTGNLRLNQPVVSMAADPKGRGYWFVASDGGIFSFGAPFHGSAGSLRLNQPVVGMAPTATGGGYWLVARDGGIFSYGDARFSGSTGHLRLNQPIVGMAADPDGVGYWFVAADGGVFAFDADFSGSGVGRLAAGDTVVGMVASRGGGYWLVTSRGAVLGFGAAAGIGRAGA